MPVQLRRKNNAYDAWDGWGFGLAEKTTPFMRETAEASASRKKQRLLCVRRQGHRPCEQQKGAMNMNKNKGKGNRR